jgi:hypothetical protein
MPRAKLSNWRELDVPEWRVEHLYTEEVWKNIIKCLRTNAPVNAVNLPRIDDESERNLTKGEILRIARNLNALLYALNSPTSGEQRFAIKSVQSSAGKLRKVLKELDPVSLDALRREVDEQWKDAQDKRREADEVDEHWRDGQDKPKGRGGEEPGEEELVWKDPEAGFPHGDLVRASIRVANQLVCIARGALNKLPKIKVGRRRLDHQREAEDKLKALWAKYRGSVSPSPKFIEVALAPILERHVKDLDSEAAKVAQNRKLAERTRAEEAERHRKSKRTAQTRKATGLGRAAPDG